MPSVIINAVAEIRPFRGLRYAPNIDLPTAICPPYDVISPQEQKTFHQLSPYNAIHIELAEDGEERYQRAAETLGLWLRDGTLRRDGQPAFYLYRQQFQHSGHAYQRLMLFARLRLEEWERNVVLPHERTFGAPKEDRLKLLRAIRLNTSPIFLLYRDARHSIAPLLAEAAALPTAAEFASGSQNHALWHVQDPALIAALTQAFTPEKLYVADGHHRYETSLAYRDERRAVAPVWTGSEPENFALAALTSVDDPGLLVLPIHRLIRSDVPLQEVLERLTPLFDVEAMPSSLALLNALTTRSLQSSAFGLIAAESSDPYLLTVRELEAVDRLLPQDRPPIWRQLDAAIATYAVLGHGLGLNEAQMADYSTLWFTEDAEAALESVRSGRCRYALLLNPVPVRHILAVADAGERMPQKSTFFYPKVPTGLVFNPLDD